MKFKFLPPLSWLAAFFLFFIFLSVIAHSLANEPNLRHHIWPWTMFGFYLVGCISIFIRKNFSFIYCSTLLSTSNGIFIYGAITRTFDESNNFFKQIGTWILPAALIFLFIRFTFGAPSKRYIQTVNTAEQDAAANP